VIIEDDVWLGTKCTILPGVRIGRGAVVVANALVTRNVEPFAIVSGVPAQKVAQLDSKKFVIDPTA
jgi:acetyltransferase-like isoleucine patch superfamily enzyme